LSVGDLSIEVKLLFEKCLQVLLIGPNRDARSDPIETIVNHEQKVTDIVIHIRKIKKVDMGTEEIDTDKEIVQDPKRGKDAARAPQKGGRNELNNFKRPVVAFHCFFRVHNSDQKVKEEIKYKVEKVEVKREPGFGGINVRKASELLAEAAPKEAPNFEVSGKLLEDTNVFNGVVVKYSEPEGKIYFDHMVLRR